MLVLELEGSTGLKTKDFSDGDFLKFKAGCV